MLVTVAIVPGPPAFVAELMGSAAHELDELRQAADLAVSRAVSDLVAASTDPPAAPLGSAAISGSATLGSATLGSAPSGSAQLVVVGPGKSGEFNAAGPVSFASFGCNVMVPALVEGERTGHEQTDRELPTPLMVARYLASRDIAAHPEHAELWASAHWITTTGADATTLAEQLSRDDTRVALILVADGAACHGPKAPRAQDSRARAYDDGVCAALASGRPDRMARLDADLGLELGATGPNLWPILAAATGGDGIGDVDGIGTVSWIGEVLWAGAPYGVGWAVASWRRPQGRVAVLTPTSPATATDE